jgi:dihydropyrimidinase
MSNERARTRGDQPLHTPTRPSWHADILWKAIGSGDIHTVGSDHWAFNYSGQKDLGKEDFTQAPRGFPGIQERLAVLFSAGIHTGKISPNRLELGAQPTSFSSFPQNL